MNGPHDVGGLHGFGVIEAEQNEPVFHEEWEGRVCGVSLALAAVGNHVVDEFRYAIEHMPHSDYYKSSYFERWLFALERLAYEKGLLTSAEVDARAAEGGGAVPPAGSGGHSELAAGMREVLIRSAPDHSTEAATPPRFAPGDPVRAANLHVREHLRLPGYAKNHAGHVHAYRGAFPHPGPLASCLEPRVEHLYTVGFKASELWGESAERPGDDVYVELFEDYIEPRRPE
jgi:nitrile hydratase beta subunit